MHALITIIFSFFILSTPQSAEISCSRSMVRNHFSMKGSPSSIYKNKINQVYEQNKYRIRFAPPLLNNIITHPYLWNSMGLTNRELISFLKLFEIDIKLGRPIDEELIREIGKVSLNEQKKIFFFLNILSSIYIETLNESPFTLLPQSKSYQDFLNLLGMSTDKLSPYIARHSFEEIRNYYLEKEIKVQNYKLENSVFKTTRRLTISQGGESSYEAKLHSSFLDWALNLASNNAVIFDLGVGNALAWKDYYQRPLKYKAKVLGISYNELNPKDLNQLLKLSQDNFYYMGGYLFEDISSKSLTATFGKADAVVDVFGVLSYSLEPIKSLNKIFKLLQAQGTIYTHSSNTFIQKKDGMIIPVYEWLSQFPQIDIVKEEPSKRLSQFTKYAIRLKSPHFQLPTTELLLVTNSPGLPVTKKIFREN